MNKHFLSVAFLAANALLFASCSDDNSPSSDQTQPEESDAKYFGQAVGNFTADEWYPGGELGTTDNISSNCYEDETPAVNQQGLLDQFNNGDHMASTRYTENTSSTWSRTSTARGAAPRRSGDADSRA